MQWSLPANLGAPSILSIDFALIVSSISSRITSLLPPLYWFERGKLSGSERRRGKLPVQGRVTRRRHCFQSCKNDTGQASFMMTPVCWKNSIQTRKWVRQPGDTISVLPVNLALGRNREQVILPGFAHFALKGRVKFHALKSPQQTTVCIVGVSLMHRQIVGHRP